MGIVDELHARERRLLLMAMSEANNPMGQLAMDHYGGALPEDFDWINKLIDRDFLKMSRMHTIRDPDDKVDGTRYYYRITASGHVVGTEVQQRMMKGLPDTLEGFREAVRKMAAKIMNTIPEGETGFQRLELMKEQVNSLPIDFEVITKIDHNEETWTFDVVRRIGRKR